MALAMHLPWSRWRWLFAALCLCFFTFPAFARLSEETYSVTDSLTRNDRYLYDGGAAGGPGVLTKLSTTNGVDGPARTITLDAMSRPSTSANNSARHRAYGLYNGPATVNAWLDDIDQPITVLTNSSTTWPFTWQADLELTPEIGRAHV